MTADEFMKIYKESDSRVVCVNIGNSHLIFAEKDIGNEDIIVMPPEQLSKLTSQMEHIDGVIKTTEKEETHVGGQ